MSCFCLNFHPRILASMDGSCLWWLLLLLWCSCIPSRFITWNSSVRKSCIFIPGYLYPYSGLMDLYFVLWVRFQYYCDLSFLLNLFQLGSWGVLLGGLLCQQPPLLNWLGLIVLRWCFPEDQTRDDLRYCIDEYFVWSSGKHHLSTINPSQFKSGGCYC